MIEQLFVFVVLLVVFGTMQFGRKPVEVLFCLALGLFALAGIIDLKEAWRGFSEGPVIAIAGLLVVAAGLRSSGVLDALGRALLGRVRSERSALGRLAAVLVPCSAFLLNTALVVMLLPVVVSWCRRQNIAPSRLLIPISYFAILGGTCSLVGTSTNFVVDGELRKISQAVAHADKALAPEAIEPPTVIEAFDKSWIKQQSENLAPMSLTEISWVGVPCAIIGVSLFILFGSRLLPDRRELLDVLGDQRREYLVEMMVGSGCALIGKSVEEGGLRHLPGLFLIEIVRDEEVIAPVAPDTRIQEHDRLVFTGVVATIIDLEKIPGLVPAADMNYEISTDSRRRSLVEVVLSPTSPLVGSTIKQANFRYHYNAAVVAVHRNGERLPTKIGDIELLPGDTLLLQTQPGFVRLFRNRPDFYLVSNVEGAESRRHNKLIVASGLTLALVAWLISMPFLKSWGLPPSLCAPELAIFTMALSMIGTRCLSASEARRAIDLPMLLTVGAAIGVGRSVHACGGDRTVAEFLLNFTGSNPYIALAILLATTIVFTEMLTNVAVATMMFYVGLQMAYGLGDVSPRPFIMAVAFGASLSFISPIGYQTNLLVMGPGVYRPNDYIRAGLPLSLILACIALGLIPIVWPF